jgi:hypothetical protein
MKQILFLFIVTSAFACTSADQTSSVDKEKALKDTAHFTTIQWLDSTTKDLGKIEQGQVIELTYKFRNSGNNPLIIANVRGGCGCTGAEGPTQPIAPGKEGEIKAKFNSLGMHGTVLKDVFVKANDSNPNSEGQDVLKFTADVEPKGGNNASKN